MNENKERVREKCHTTHKQNNSHACIHAYTCTRIRSQTIMKAPDLEQLDVVLGRYVKEACVCVRVCVSRGVHTYSTSSSMSVVILKF